MLISFEGLPGVGKSTLLDKLKIKLKDKIVILPEPLEHITYLPLSYPEGKYSFHLQWQFITERTKLYLPYLSNIEDKETIVVCERTMMSERYVFMEYVKSMNFITESEFVLLDDMYRIMEMLEPNIIIPNKIVYFDIPLEEIMDRISKRGRLNEKKKWNKSNISELNRHYKSFIGGCAHMGLPIHNWGMDSSLEELLDFIIN